MLYHIIFGSSQRGVSKGGFSNTNIIIAYQLLNPPLLNPLCELPIYQVILLNATTRRGADGEVTGVIGVGQEHIHIYIYIYMYICMYPSLSIHIYIYIY